MNQLDEVTITVPVVEHDVMAMELFPVWEGEVSDGPPCMLLSTHCIARHSTMYLGLLMISMATVTVRGASL